MAYATDRIQLFDCRDNPIGEIVPCALRPDGQRLRNRILELNGEHSLTIATTRVLEKGMRALTIDGTGKRSEWVVDAIDELHASGRCAVGTYTLIWSLQSDLETVYGAELRPGIPNPVPAVTAVAAALNGTNRWIVGTVDVTTTGSLSMYDNSAWERLSDVVSVFGGELDAEITVDSTGVVSRKVNLRAHLGSTTVTRRFDWTRDLKSIRRVPKVGPRFCRVIPRGKGEQVESSTGGVAYTRRINIKSVNDGVEYLRDQEAEEAFKLPDGNGGWEYPTCIVIYESIEDPQELYDTALADLHNHTRPEVTYEASVIQLARAGMDIRGISLGDDVHVVDRGFREDSALRIKGRVVRMEIDDITGNTNVTLGSLSPNLADTFSSLDKAIKEIGNLAKVLEAGGTAEYVDTLIGRINQEINATGGYTYLVPGIGAVTYDTAASNPAVGSEASQATEMRGGTLRFANSRTSGGDWNWTNVITANGYLGLAATIARITTGFIGSAGDTYIDLDNHTARFGPDDGYHLTIDTNGLRFWYANTLLGQYLSASMQLGTSGSSHINVDTSGVELFDTNGTSILFAGLSNNTPIVRVGKETGSGNVVMSSAGYVDVRNANTVLAHFGYALGVNDTGGMTIAPYYDVGVRKSGTVIGNYSMCEGKDTTASNFCAHAEGVNTVASGLHAHAEGEQTTASSYESHAEGHKSTASASYAHAEGDQTLARGACSHAEGRKTEAALEAHAEGDQATASGEASHAEGTLTTASNSDSHAEGNGTEASGWCGHAEGYKTVASAAYSHAEGNNTEASGMSQHVCGRWNTITSSPIFIIGAGNNATDRKNVAYATASKFYVNGTEVVSDKRIKTHHAYLGEHKLVPCMSGSYLDERVVDFVRSLRPAIYDKNDTTQLGFYAQEIEEYPLFGACLVDQTRNYDMDDFRTLDYTALIAPLVAYAQNLERRIDEQQERIKALEAR